MTGVGRGSCDLYPPVAGRLRRLILAVPLGAGRSLRRAVAARRKLLELTGLGQLFGRKAAAAGRLGRV